MASRQKTKDAQQDVAIKNNADAVKIIAKNEEEQSKAIESEQRKNYEQDKAIQKNKDLNDTQTVNIVKNAEKIKKVEKDAEDSRTKQKSKDKEQDDEIEMVDSLARLRHDQLRKEMNLKFSIAIILALAALGVALFL